MESARGKVLKSRRSQVQRDSRLASCDYITVTQEGRDEEEVCVERCEVEGLRGSRGGGENK